MKNSYKHFSNTECKFFNCHQIANQSCLFCYCPLFNYDCGGNFIIFENGKKDCSGCILPHDENGYDYVVDFLKKV